MSAKELHFHRSGRMLPLPKLCMFDLIEMNESICFRAYPEFPEYIDWKKITHPKQLLGKFLTTVCVWLRSQEIFGKAPTRSTGCVNTKHETSLPVCWVVDKRSEYVWGYPFHEASFSQKAGQRHKLAFVRTSAIPKWELLFSVLVNLEVPFFGHHRRFFFHLVVSIAVSIYQQ